MPDDQPLNDESLSRIEDLLTKIDLRADGSERTKILIACGRAEGRAELQRMLRRWKAGALALSTLSVCLLTAIVLRPPASAPEMTSNIAESEIEQIHNLPRIRERSRRHIATDETLRASTDWSSWMESMESRPRRTNGENDVEHPQRSTLMASSRIDLREFMD